MALRDMASRPWTAGAVVTFIVAMLAAALGVSSAGTSVARPGTLGGPVAAGPADGSAVVTHATSAPAADTTVAAPSRTDADDPGHLVTPAAVTDPVGASLPGAVSTVGAAGQVHVGSDAAAALWSRAPPVTDAQSA